ncbi:MAG TPA: hypothetical protein VKU77_10335, partial [Streptosporangiaceae bacterium]|nr:hypothetical protein [Streptosporangiaceae bacterium]
MAAHAAVRVRTRPSWLRWSRRPAALQASAQPQEPAPADHAAPPAVRWADSPFAGRSVEIAHEPAGAPVSPAELTTLDGPPAMSRPFAPPPQDEPVPPPLAWLRIVTGAGEHDYQDHQLHGLPAFRRVTDTGVPVAEVLLGDALALSAVYAADEQSLRALAAAAAAAADALAAETAAR